MSAGFNHHLEWTTMNVGMIIKNVLCSPTPPSNWKTCLYTTAQFLTLSPITSVASCSFLKNELIQYCFLAYQDSRTPHIATSYTATSYKFWYLLILCGQHILPTSGLFYWQFYKYSSCNALLTLYISFIRSHLEYAVAAWDPFLRKDIKKHV